MRQKIMFVVISILFFSCKKESKQKPKGKSIVNSTKINTISQSEQLKAVDKLLYELVDNDRNLKRYLIKGQ